MTVFEGITREQRKRLPVPTQELPLIQRTSSAGWQCVTSLKRRFDLSGIWRKASDKKIEEREHKTESESCCEVTFKEMPPCHRITVLKWLLGRRQRFYYSLKCSPMGFGLVWKSHFSMRSGVVPLAYCLPCFCISSMTLLCNGETWTLPWQASRNIRIQKPSRFF